jgi:hypothetical protein
MALLYISPLFLDISRRECGNSTTKLSAFVIFFAPFFVVIYLPLFSPFHLFFIARRDRPVFFSTYGPVSLVFEFCYLPSTFQYRFCFSFPQYLSNLNLNFFFVFLKNQSTYFKPQMKIGTPTEVRGVQRTSKVHPVASHVGTTGDMYNFSLSLTWAFDRGGWSSPLFSRFTAGNDPVRFV